jgi:histone H3/H4
MRVTSFFFGCHVLNEGMRVAPAVLDDGIYRCTIFHLHTIVRMDDVHEHVATPCKATKAKHKWRSGTVAKREIVKFSKSTHSIIPSTPFQRLVREITAALGKEVNFKKTAMDAIQETAEQMLVELFLKGDITRINAGRQTLHIRDIKFAKYVTDDMHLLSDANKYVNGMLSQSDPVEETQIEDAI